MSLRITYLLEDTPISGLVRTVLAQADALIAHGHRVRIATQGAPVAWRASRAEWLYVDDFRALAGGDDDVTVSTSPATAAEGTVALPRGYLIVDDDFYRVRTVRENEPLRVLLCGAAQDETKGLDDGYGAAAHARWFHQRFDLVRVAPWAPSREEPLDGVQEFHVGLYTPEIVRLIHSCDVLVVPSHREETSILAAAEGLAGGLAAVMTATPAHGAIDPAGDYARFAPAENAVELGERLIEVLESSSLRDRLRARGRAVAEGWRAQRVGAALDEFFERVNQS